MEKIIQLHNSSVFLSDTKKYIYILKAKELYNIYNYNIKNNTVYLVNNRKEELFLPLEEFNELIHTLINIVQNKELKNSLLNIKKELDTYDL